MKNRFLAISVAIVILSSVLLLLCGCNAQQATETSDVPNENGTVESNGQEEPSTSGAETNEQPSSPAKKTDKLPYYVYSGDDIVVGAIANYINETMQNSLYITKTAASIPCPIILKIDYKDDNHVTVWGNFYILVYEPRDNVLFCISGRENPGVVFLEKVENNWIVTNSKFAEEGDLYYGSLQEICEGDENLVKSYSNNGIGSRADVRMIFISDYLKSNNLSFESYQDYGRDPVIIVY